MKIWSKLTHEAISKRVFGALETNIDYRKRKPLGLPASHLDERVFYNNPIILSDAPYLSTLLRNPNHIGCHTMGDSEPFFKGTQDIEREVIRICAEDIFEGDEDAQDGYVAAGGTEANIQAVWMNRNYFMAEFGAKLEEIAILFSSDAHYSFYKAANLLQIKTIDVPVNDVTRQMDGEVMVRQLKEAKTIGVKYIIAVANMMTTMFGSTDDPEMIVSALDDAGMQWRLHVDGAYGGFVYPFLNPGHKLSFRNADVSSVTLDAHKMVQAPYGTGILLCRKHMLPYTMTNQAEYVNGLDVTLNGSRSGANAVSIWMILQTYGPHGWFEKIHLLSYRGDWFERQLRKLNIDFYRDKGSNIITMRAGQFPETLVEKYGLVPDSHGGEAHWYKVVIMDHVSVDDLDPFVRELAELKK